MIGRLGLVALALAALPALAGTAARAEPRRQQAQFEQMDVNRDGFVTADEMATFRLNRFAGTDRDGDGIVTRAEIVAAMQERASRRRPGADAAARAEKMADRLLSRSDRDGDGAISSEEMQSVAVPRAFRRMDANGDGALSREEADAWTARVAERRRARPAAAPLEAPPPAQ